VNFPLFGVCPSNKPCPSAQCAYAANAVDKDLDILTIGAVSLNHMYTHQLKLLILFVHNPNALCYVVLVISPRLRLFDCLLFCNNLFFFLQYLPVICL
jgi:hypothetical protein